MNKPKIAAVVSDVLRTSFLEYCAGTYRRIPTNPSEIPEGDPLFVRTAVALTSSVNTGFILDTTIGLDLTHSTVGRQPHPAG